MTASKGDPATLLSAVLAVQTAVPTLKKDRTVTVKTRAGGEYTYSYAPLDSITEKIREHMAANGLVWMTFPGYDDQGRPVLRYRLYHAPTGESVTDQMHLVIHPDHEHDIQALGSAITYTRRYALCAVLDLVADADDDGRGAGGNLAGSSRPASDKQLTFLKRLKTQNNVTDHEMGVLMKGAGFAFVAGESFTQAFQRLSASQASALIDEIQQGALKTGEPELPPPAEGEFVHPPGGEVPQELDLGQSILRSQGRTT